MRIDQYAIQVNKRHKKVVFKPNDWVWVHMHKETFPFQRKSKLQLRRDSPFQMIARINDNTYKIDFSGKYNVSATFKVFDLCPLMQVTI